MSLQTVLSKLDARKNGSGWKAKCPAHGDEKPSLSISEGTDGKILLHCFAGCTFDEIVAACPLEISELFTDTPQPKAHLNGHSKTLGSPVATYDYKDLDRSLRFQSVRYDKPKDFRQRRPGPNGQGWIWNLEGIERILYRLPELIAADPRLIVYVVEGEKDVDRLIDAGLVATTNPEGAGKWRHEYSETLAGRKVAIIVDNDDAGRKHAAQVAASVFGVAKWVKIIELAVLPPKGDVSDWLDSGHSADELREIVIAAPLVNDAPKERLPGLVCLEDVEPEPVHWLWPGRIPLGKLTILDGDPGLGKSMITCDIASRVSTGRAMPDGEYSDLGAPAGVVLLSAEDGLADTIRPRLDAAGADCKRIAALTHVVDEKGLMKAPSVADISDIERAIAATGAKLIVIDPVMAFLPEKTKSHNDQEVRRVLSPLVELAEKTGVAVLMLRHLNKAPGGNPLYRGGGSIAFIGAVRSGLLAAPDPEDETGRRRIIASTKSNLAMAAQALAYHVETAENGAARIVWEGITSHTAAGLLTVVDQEEKSALDDAMAFLRDLLTDGEYAASEVEKKAKANSIAIRTLHRAKSRLGVMSHRRGSVTDAHWVWALPEKKEA